MEQASSAHGPAPDGRFGDADFIAAVLRGDAAAREEFVVRMRCVPRFLAALNRQSGGPFDAHGLHDLAQETVLAVWRKLPEYRGPGALEAWAFGVAQRQFLGTRRTLARRAQRVGALGNAPEPAADEVPEHAHDESVLHALDELAPAEREVLRMRHERRVTFAEIGRELGVPENTIKTRYHRALRRLRELVQRRVSRGGRAP